MTKRYTPAFEQIRTILASRTQAEPLLEAQDVWDQLDCWPVPSVRTVRRFMGQVRADFGRHGQIDFVGRGGQDIIVPCLIMLGHA